MNGLENIDRQLCEAWEKVFHGNLDEAMADFNKIIASHPNYAETYYARAILKMYRGDKDGAFNDYYRFNMLNQRFSNPLNYNGNHNGSYARNYHSYRR